jgi:predicted transporter
MNFCIIFVGIISGKPLLDFTRPLGSPMGLKGLLYMLNAIVFPTIEEVE